MQNCNSLRGDQSHFLCSLMAVAHAGVPVWPPADLRANFEADPPARKSTMIDHPIRLRALALYPALKSVHAADLDQLFAAASHVKAPPGAVLFDDGQACQGFPLLLSGLARIVKAAPNGRELHLYDVAAGDTCILTSSCLLSKSNYHARGVAQTEIEVVMLPPAAFHRLFSNAEEFRNHVFSRFSERLTELLQLVSAVSEPPRPEAVPPSCTEPPGLNPVALKLTRA